MDFAGPGPARAPPVLSPPTRGVENPAGRRRAESLFVRPSPPSQAPLGSSYLGGGRGMDPPASSTPAERPLGVGARYALHGPRHPFVRLSLTESVGKTYCPNILAPCPIYLDRTPSRSVSLPDQGGGGGRIQLSQPPASFPPPITSRSAYYGPSCAGDGISLRPVAPVPLSADGHSRRLHPVGSVRPPPSDT